LHRHALESVLGFSALRELGKIRSVSKEWRAAVLSMHSIGASVSTETPESLARLLLSSPLWLRRHVGHLRTVPEYYSANPMVLSAADIERIAVGVPHLHSLDIALTDDVESNLLELADGPLSMLPLPASLRSLSLRWHKSARPEQVRENLQSLVVLEHLNKLQLELSTLGVSLAPLRQMPSLRTLVLRDECIGSGDADSVSDSDDAAPLAFDLPSLRTLAQLEHLTIGSAVFSIMAEKLLSAPHQLQGLKSLSSTGPDVDPLRVTAAQAALLTSLPHLAQLSLVIEDPAASDCLRSLPNLTDLELCYGSFFETPGATVNGNADAAVAHMLASLASCRGLQRLKLSSELNSPFGDQRIRNAQIGALLAQMPLLAELRLDNVHVDSLEFLSCGSLPRTLTSLSLRRVTPLLAQEQLTPLGALKSLVSLELHNVLSSRLERSGFARRMLTPPWSAVWLPALQKSDIDEAYHLS
jgi:hypothetical protein